MYRDSGRSQSGRRQQLHVVGGGHGAIAALPSALPSTPIFDRLHSTIQPTPVARRARLLVREAQWRCWMGDLEGTTWAHRLAPIPPPGTWARRRPCRPTAFFLSPSDLDPDMLWLRIFSGSASTHDPLTFSFRRLARQRGSPSASGSSKRCTTTSTLRRERRDWRHDGPCLHCPQVHHRWRAATMTETRVRGRRGITRED